VLGLMATLVTGVTDPGVLILQIMDKVGLAIPALVMVVFSTVTSDFPDVYSATCSMMNISQKVGARSIMWIAGILSILVALIFPMEQYENFLLFIGAMFMPLFGVVLSDYFIVRKRRLQVDALFRREGGAYWYFKGFNTFALLSWGIGFLTYEFITIMKYTIGGSIPSILVAGMCYLLLVRRREI